MSFQPSNGDDDLSRLNYLDLNGQPAVLKNPGGITAFSFVRDPNMSPPTPSKSTAQYLAKHGGQDAPANRSATADRRLSPGKMARVARGTAQKGPQTQASVPNSCSKAIPAFFGFGTGSSSTAALATQSGFASAYGSGANLARDDLACPGRPLYATAKKNITGKIPADVASRNALEAEIAAVNDAAMNELIGQTSRATGNKNTGNRFSTENTDEAINKLANERWEKEKHLRLGNRWANYHLGKHQQDHENDKEAQESKRPKIFPLNPARTAGDLGGSDVKANMRLMEELDRIQTDEQFAQLHYPNGGSNFAKDSFNTVIYKSAVKPTSSLAGPQFKRHTEGEFLTQRADSAAYAEIMGEEAPEYAHLPEAGKKKKEKKSKGKGKNQTANEEAAAPDSMISAAETPSQQTFSFNTPVDDSDDGYISFWTAEVEQQMAQGFVHDNNCVCDLCFKT